MASKCPKCHQYVEDDTVCCAGVQYTWKCRSCGKLSAGFVVPYGRCFLCGGENQVIQGYRGDDPTRVAIVQEAMQYELDMYHFYRLGMSRTGDSELRNVLEEMYHKEEDHLAELEKKYHVHLDPQVLQLTPDIDRLLAGWLFEGIDFDNPKGHVLQVYDKAIELERRTRDHFQAKAEALPPSREKETYRELAAEEEEHVALLETERQQFEK